MRAKDILKGIKENTESIVSGNFAGSMGAGNGFLNGGPGTIRRAPGSNKKKSKKKKR